MKYDAFTTKRYFKTSDVRLGGPPDAPKTYPVYRIDDRVEGLRFRWAWLGKYGIYSYGAPGSIRLYLGHFELRPGGQYRVSRTDGAPYFAEGRYRFDSAAVAVEWLSGPYAIPERGGKFSVKRAEHHIALRARTIAVNAQ